jgi:hypothetical protein
MKPILRCAVARAEEKRKEADFRLYIADCLQNISENTAKQSGGAYVSARFADLVKPKPVDHRTAEQVVADVAAGAGLEVIWA